MKFKLHLLAIATIVGLTACGDEDKTAANSASVDADAKQQEVELKKATPEVVSEEKEPELDWEEPTEMYYTMGLSPLDPSALINRYKIDKKSQYNAVWINTDKTTLGDIGTKEGNGSLYRHENVYDEPETPNDEQLEAISGLLEIEKAMAYECKKLTERMSFKLEQNDYSKLFVLLETVGKKKVQTWFFQHKEEDFYLIAKRDIAEPKGFISRCKGEFDKAVISPALTRITYQF